MHATSLVVPSPGLRDMTFLGLVCSNGAGCHDLGVFDKVVLVLDFARDHTTVIPPAATTHRPDTHWTSMTVRSFHDGSPPRSFRFSIL